MVTQYTWNFLVYFPKLKYFLASLGRQDGTTLPLMLRFPWQLFPRPLQKRSPFKHSLAIFWNHGGGFICPDITVSWGATNISNYFLSMYVSLSSLCVQMKKSHCYQRYRLQSPAAPVLNVPPANISGRSPRESPSHVPQTSPTQWHLIYAFSLWLCFPHGAIYFPQGPWEGLDATVPSDAHHENVTAHAKSAFSWCSQSH